MFPVVVVADVLGPGGVGDDQDEMETDSLSSVLKKGTFQDLLHGKIYNLV